MLRLRLFFIFSLLCSGLITCKSYAICFFYGMENMYAVQSFNIPLSVTLSVPPGIVTGQTIYQQTINPQNIKELWIKCTTKGQFKFAYNYQTAPLPLTSLTHVYETGVPGIGIKFSTAGHDFPFEINNTDCSNTVDCHYPYGWNAISSFSLVKTADNVSAGTIYGSRLPSVFYQLGQSGDMIDIYQFSISGAINITVPTCDISPASTNMYVQMGTTNSSSFYGPGTGAGWHDASILLINCTHFFGNSSGGSSGATFNGTSTTYSISPNRAEVTLTPLNGIIDAANGVMKIDDHPQKASGVGIQLSTTRSTSGKVDFSSPVLYALPQDGASTVTLPLYARYVQTESSVAEGIANGRLEYTITYQ